MVVSYVQKTEEEGGGKAKGKKAQKDAGSYAKKAAEVKKVLEAVGWGGGVLMEDEDAGESTADTLT